MCKCQYFTPANVAACMACGNTTAETLLELLHEAVASSDEEKIHAAMATVDKVVPFWNKSRTNQG